LDIVQDRQLQELHKNQAAATTYTLALMLDRFTEQPIMRLLLEAKQIQHWLDSAQALRQSDIQHSQNQEQFMVRLLSLKVLLLEL
jgi:hypothetical protein